VDAGPAPFGPEDRSPPKKPPAPKKPPPLPPLPDLPALEKQEPALRLPLGLVLRLPQSPCNGTWNGQEVVPAACARGALFGRDAEGAEPIVPPKLLRGDRQARPRVVDHRFDKTEGPVRSQGRAPACTAFATAAALDHAVARWTGVAPSTAVMLLWSRYHTPQTTKAIAANLGLVVGSEADWRFDARTAMGWLPCPSGKPPPEGCGLTPDPKRAAQLEGKPVATFTDVEYIDEPDVEDLEEHLAAGQDVLVGMDLPQSFAPRGKPGARYVSHYVEAAPDSGHAVLVAGYARLEKSTYFLLHNSWGQTWGDGGYAWIHEQTLLSHLREALVVEAEPEVAGTKARPVRERGSIQCTEPLVPDALRGICTPACADGSPRHDGVCPVDGQCPDGLVNLTGTCTAAAPSAKGQDPRTGVRWSCGAGGCSYVLPRAVAKDCPGEACMASCPAPTFRIARARGTLTCIE
jgi:hypothetical protein